MTPLDLVTHHEGIRLHVYDDATGHAVVPGYTLIGHPTIGTGRALDTHGISEDERQALLQADLADAEGDIASLFGGKLKVAGDARIAALIDMRFELGAAGFREFKELIAAVLAMNWDAAADAALHSLWATQATIRAQQDATMIRTGIWPVLKEA